MTDRNSYIKTMALYFGGAILTMVTFIFGAIPMNALYRVTGRGLFWVTWLAISCLSFGMGFKVLAVSLFTLTLLVGAFNEFKRGGAGYFSAGAAATFFTSSFWFVGTYFWAMEQGPGWFESIKQASIQSLESYFPAGSQSIAQIDINEVILQLPSALIIIFILSLFLASLLEKRVLLWMGITPPKRESLLTFRLPDLTVWLFISSLLAAFLKTEIVWLNPAGMNLLNVILVLYFLQGLAVVTCYLNLIKASPFWRFLIYFIISSQLFLVVCLLGLIDFWVDFRLKMIRKAAELKNNTWTNKA